MRTFRAFQVIESENSLSTQLVNKDFDALPEGEVVIKVSYSSVNYKDALAATGQGRLIRQFPLTPGIDLVGSIVESSDSRFQADDKVIVTGYELGTGHDGGYAEYARVPAEWVVSLPEGMTEFTAMALGTAGFTVALCIKRLEENAQSPDLGPFVVTGGTGGVGSIAIDVLSKLGYEVHVTSRKSESHDYLKDLGASDIIDMSQFDLSGPPLQKGIWGGAIDNVGSDVLAWLTRTVRPWGNICSVGLAAGSDLSTTVMPFILRGVSLLGITSSGCPTPIRQGLWERLANDLAPVHLDEIITQTITLEELDDFFAEMLAGKTVGRTVVKIGTDIT